MNTDKQLYIGLYASTDKVLGTEVLILETFQALGNGLEFPGTLFFVPRNSAVVAGNI
jgi:hypothetical protein